MLYMSKRFNVSGNKIFQNKNVFDNKSELTYFRKIK